MTAAGAEAAFAARDGRSAAAGPLLEVIDIVKRYGGVEALRGVSLQLGRGEVLALAGENGSGKSTLIRTIAGVERPDSGRVLIDRLDWTRAPPRARINAGIQIIYQDFAPFPNLTAAENIWLPRQLGEGRFLVSRKKGEALARRVLDSMGVALDLNRALGELPVAHKQIAAIARALTFDARLIIMDEPTTALTHRDVEHLFTIIRGLAAKGMSFIFVSHKLRELAEICERAVVLRNGAKTLDAPLSTLTEADIQRAMTGRELVAGRVPRTPPDTSAPPRLAVETLTRAPDFQDISFTVAPGEVVGLAGLMGAGRTALAKAIFGMAPADTGSIAIDGRPAPIRSIAEAIAHGIGYVPEDRLSEGLFLDFPIRDNIVVRALDRIASATGWITRARRSREAASWIEKLQIKTPSDALPVSTLSGGNQQRVVLAKWMASRPRLLILNRPTVGVDVGSKADIHAIISDLAASGLGIIVISDEVSELLAVSDRILIMRQGRILAERAAEGLSEDAILDLVNEAGT